MGIMRNPTAHNLKKIVAQTRVAMVNFNTGDIATLQLFKNFIVFIVSRSSDAELI